MRHLDFLPADADARHVALRRGLRVAAVLVAAALAAFADGGNLLLRRQTGPLIVTVFGAPRVGSSDISVLVQRAEDRSAVLDANVELQIGDARVQATHEAATNKLLYAAAVELARSGKTHLRVDVTTRDEKEHVEGDVEVAPEPPAVVKYWPYFVLVPVMVLLFALNQRLKDRRRIKRF